MDDLKIPGTLSTNIDSKKERFEHFIKKHN